MGNLTLKSVERARQKPGRYGDGGGLYLQVTSPTNCCWLFRWERGGRERSMGLGPLRTFSLPEARERARKVRQLLADGIDPLEARRAEHAAGAECHGSETEFRDEQARPAERVVAHGRFPWLRPRHCRSPCVRAETESGRSGRHEPAAFDRRRVPPCGKSG